jgi:hypothetical protein
MIPYTLANQSKLNNRAAAAAAAVQGERFEVHHVHTRLPLRAAALGDNGSYVVLFENNKWACSSNLSESGVYKRMKEGNADTSDLAYVALGRNQGSDAYDAAAPPARVAFARLDKESVAGTTYVFSGCKKGLKHTWWETKDDRRAVTVCIAPTNGYRRWWLLSRNGDATRKGLPAPLDSSID